MGVVETAERLKELLDQYMVNKGPKTFKVSQPCRVTVQNKAEQWGKEALIGDEELELHSFYPGKKMGVICRFKPKGWGKSSGAEASDIKWVEWPLKSVSADVASFASFIDTLTNGQTIDEIVRLGVKESAFPLAGGAMMTGESPVSSLENPEWGTW